MTAATMAEHDAVSPAWRGRVGMIGLIVAETSLFAVFVVAYLFYIGKSLNGPYPKDVLELPVFNTICLLVEQRHASRSASRALRSGDVRRSGVWFLVTVALGVDLPRRHREGMVRAHLRARPHHRHQSLRHDLLLPGRASRHSRDDRARHAGALLRLRLLRRAAAARTSSASRSSPGTGTSSTAVWVVVFTVVYVIGR